MTEWPFVEIVWKDITGTAEWCTVHSLPILTTVRHRGWLIAEDEDTVTICASFCEPHTDTEDWTVGDVTTIPRAVIQGKIRRLNV